VESKFLHVCHVWERFWPIEIGGVERYILWLSDYLAITRKMNFSLITGRTKILSLRQNIHKVDYSGNLKVYRVGPTAAGLVHSIWISTLKSVPNFVNKMALASYCHEAAKWKNAKTADIFHIHGVWSDLEYINMGVYLSYRFKKPLVLTLHGGFVGDPMLGGMPLESNTVHDLLFNRATAITTYSKVALDSLKRMGLGDKCHFITNFVDSKRFQNPLPNQAHKITIIYVGRMEPLQTPELVVKAFKHVHSLFPETKLLLVGYGTLFAYLQSLVKTLGIEAAVSMVGQQTDVRPFLWKSDIFVATNFGYIATLEAWAAGLAVVAQNFGVLKETVEDKVNGLLVQEHDVDDLAKALIKLVQDEKFRRKLAANGLEKVSNYDIRATAPKMATVYDLIKEK
jgi:glycosyltransferase involved in cell wall biosynthesis